MRRLIPLSSASVVLVSLIGFLAAADRDYEVIAHEGQGAPTPKQVLFFGKQDSDISHHDPPGLYDALREDFERSQIQLTFTDDLADLNPTVLEAFDAVLVYGNSRLIGYPERDALADFFAAGGGLIGVHVASWTFPTWDAYGALLGGRFLGHLAPTEFSQTYPDVDPPILAGLDPYTSVDEPYQHQMLAPDMTVLSWRDPVGASEIASNHQEPYTWIRTQGLSRVFYHAGGHDFKTWSQAGFRELLVRGVHWVTENHRERSFGQLGIPQAFVDGTILFEGDSDGAGALWAGRTASDLFQIARDGELSPLQIGGGSWILPAAETPDLAGAGGEIAMVAGIGDGVGDATLTVVRGKVGQLEALLADGDPVPGLGSGISVVLDPPGSAPHLVASAGGTLVRVALAGTAGALDDTAILKLHPGGAVTVLAREGWQVPTLPAGILFGDLSETDLSIAADGSWASVVGLMGPGVTAANDRAVIHSRDDGFISVVREGSPLPILPGIAIGEIAEAKLAGAGQVILNAALTGAVTGADDAALVRWLPSTSGLSIVVRDGDPDGGAKLLWTGSGDSWTCNGEGEVLIATTREGVGVTADSNEGIWFSDGESLVALAIEGGQIPREPHGTSYAGGLTSTPLCLSDGPMAAFRIGISGPGNLGDAIVAGSLGAFGIVFREGDPILVEGAADTIVGLTLGGAANGPALAGHRLAIRVETVGGGAAIVVVEDVRDLDGDWVEDSLELAFGTDPDLASDGQSGLPQMVIADGQVALEFRRQAQPSPLDYLLEESLDLIDWRPSTASQTLAVDQSGLPAGFERVLATGGDDRPRRFFRLRVKGP